MRYMIRDHDARQIAETLNTQLINAIVQLNGLAISPRLTFDTQEPDDLALYADALPKLVAIGAKIPASYMYEKLKIPVPEGGEDILGAPALALDTNTPQAMSALAGEAPHAAPFTPDQMQIEKLADDMLTHIKPPLQDEAIASAIRGATNPEDLVERLAVVLKDADYAEFTQHVERCLFAAEIMGYAHAK